MSGLPVSVGPYQVQTLLGRGGTAEVYRARLASGGGPVAVKVLRADRGSRERSRFIREARAARGLDHPSLVTVVDADLDSARPWIAMELVEGETLEASRRAGGTALLRLAPRICTSLLEALSVLEVAGLTHRDVTPANVLLTPTGKVRLIDLGLSPPGTSGGLGGGTPAYLSPEALRGERLGPASDLYQVGAVVYELFSDLVPHEDRSDRYLDLRRSPGERPTELAELVPGVSAAVSRLLASMLDPDPSARPQLAEALERARRIPAPWIHRPPVAQAFDGPARDPRGRPLRRPRLPSRAVLAPGGGRPSRELRPPERLLVIGAVVLILLVCLQLL